MKKKTIIQLAVILFGYIIMACVSPGCAFAIQTGETCSHYTGNDNHPGVSTDRDILSRPFPRNRQLRFRTKFRPASSFSWALLFTECNAEIAWHSFSAAFKMQKRYLLSPFYYIFLFRYTLF